MNENQYKSSLPDEKPAALICSQMQLFWSLVVPFKVRNADIGISHSLL
jgi:hypothetical protein